MIRHASIRLRLTLWYGVVLAGILILFGGSVYVLMRHHLLSLTDAGLAEELTEFTDDVARAPSPEALSPRYAQHDVYNLQVTTDTGRILFRGDRLDRVSLPFTLGKNVREGTNYATITLDPLGRLRIASRRLTTPAGALILQAATSLKPFDEASRQLLAVLLGVGATAV
jgi:two-component system heavy metal sensor histidine kinase CusS